MQLTSLWEYMQVDLEADTFENEMRQSPNRQKLLKQRNFLVEQQNNMKKIEANVLAMSDRMEALRDEAARLEGVLSEQKASFASNPPKTSEESQARMQAVRKLIDSLMHYEQEIAKIRKDSDARDRQQREIRMRAAKAKAEYDAVKQEYDGEYKRDSVKLAELRARTEKASGAVNTALLSRYRQIKQHCTPPMAKLTNDQCGGCFMKLPLGTVRDLKAGERMIECDNCGRILYLADTDGATEA